MHLNAFGLSDIGLQRPNNEDVLVSLPEVGFFALADGMGGRLAGEVAAKEAVDFMVASVAALQKTTSSSELIVILQRAIQTVNRKIYEMGRSSDAFTGMGTTLCCLFWRKDWIAYAHIGDSRIYRIRRRKLELLTQDHSLIAQWAQAEKVRQSAPPAPPPKKNVITKALGPSLRVKPDIAITNHEEGDVYLLSTDGLHDAIALPEMQAIINACEHLEEACVKLVEAAKRGGSTDNITLLMVKSQCKESI